MQQVEKMDDYFKSSSPKPKDNFRTVEDVAKDISLVESLVEDNTVDLSEMELYYIDTTVASACCVCSNEK